MSNNLFDSNSLEKINIEDNNGSSVNIKRTLMSCKVIDPFSSNSYEKIAKIEEEKISSKFRKAEKYNTIDTLDYMDIYRNECFYKKMS